MMAVWLRQSVTARWEVLVPEPSLPELEALRDRLYAQLTVVGDFQWGTATEN